MGKDSPEAPKKLGRLVRPSCRANSNEAHATDQEAAEDHEPAAPHVNPPPSKKQLPNNNWRVAHAVRSRDQTLQRISSEKAHLSQKIDSLQMSLTNQKAAVKVLTARLFVCYNNLAPRGTSVHVEPASNEPLKRANQITSTII